MKLELKIILWRMRADWILHLHKSGFTLVEICPIVKLSKGRVGDILHTAKNREQREISSTLHNLKFILAIASVQTKKQNIFLKGLRDPFPLLMKILAIDTDNKQISGK